MRYFGAVDQGSYSYYSAVPEIKYENQFTVGAGLMPNELTSVSDILKEDMAYTFAQVNKMPVLDSKTMMMYAAVGVAAILVIGVLAKGRRA
jgi:hypothetical protein